MASEIDPAAFDQQVDRLVLATTAAQSEALTKAIVAHYKAGSDDVRPSTRLTNVQKNAIKKLSAEHFGYISEFNNYVGNQIKNKAKQLLNEEKGYAETLLREANCRHRKIVFFDDPELDTPISFFEEQKKKAGLYWDDDKEDWAFRD